MNYLEIKEREEQVQKMIADGMIMADMARELGITPQSVHKFLRTRGWDKDVVKGGNSNRRKQAEADPAKQARIEARKKMNSAVDRSGSKAHKPKTTAKGKKK
jgi:uncharacterized protein YjcR